MQSDIPLERLVRLETKMDTVLATQKELVEAVKSLSIGYVSKKEYDVDIAELKLELEKMKTRNAIQVWLTSSLAAIFGIVMTILVQKYFAG